MEKTFQFKQFAIAQNLAAMKIGTDAVLLGAWCTIPEFTDSILDIGSGTGVIALMLAQRSEAMTIDAVEIEENAYLQSVTNFENSSWADRLYCYHSSFENLAKEFHEEGDTYDMIVSNPPFYKNIHKTKTLARDKARSEAYLTFSKLLEGVALLLSKDGVFSTIIPYTSENEFIQLAAANSLYPINICNVKGNKQSNYKRSLLSFSFKKSNIVKSELIIEKERHKYTEAYINLTKDFYLKM